MSHFADTGVPEWNSSRLGFARAARFGQPLTPDELASVPLISIDADDYLGAMLANWLADVDQGPVSQISVQTYPIAKALVEQHIGVALVDSFTASHCPGKGNIQSRPLATSETLRVYALAERSQQCKRIVMTGFMTGGGVTGLAAAWYVEWRFLHNEGGCQRGRSHQPPP